MWFLDNVKFKAVNGSERIKLDNCKKGLKNRWILANINRANMFKSRFSFEKVKEVKYSKWKYLNEKLTKIFKAFRSFTGAVKYIRRCIGGEEIAVNSVEGKGSV